MKIILTPEQEQEILRLSRDEKLTVAQISKIFRIGRKIIFKVFKKHKWDRKERFTKRIENLIFEIYSRYINEKLSIAKLAEIYNTTSVTITKIFNKNNLVIKKTNKKYQLNEFYFDKIDTSDKAYWLGFIYADGNISRNALSVSLSLKDKIVIDNLIQSLEYSGKYKILPETTGTIEGHTFKAGPKIRLDITNKHLTRGLIKLGCFPKKSLIIKFPTSDQVPNYLVRHFIRGYFDGDGCVHSREQKFKRILNRKDFYFNILGTLNFCNKIKEIFNIELGLNTRNVTQTGNIYSYSISGNNNIALIYNYLYLEANTFLPRKEEKMKEVFIQPNILKSVCQTTL